MARSGTAESAGRGVAQFLGKNIYDLLSTEEPKHIDDIVEQSGLNSPEVLATLFDLEMKGIIRQTPGKQCSKVRL
jgi:predicted Rossmann fold nucleotide-binding protein DprA/Smf involved in DNA uptake